MDDVCIESDCKGLVKWVNGSGDLPDWHCVALMEELKLLPEGMLGTQICKQSSPLACLVLVSGVVLVSLAQWTSKLFYALWIWLLWMLLTGVELTSMSWCLLFSVFCLVCVFLCFGLVLFFWFCFNWRFVFGQKQINTEITFLGGKAILVIRV